MVRTTDSQRAELDGRILREMALMESNHEPPCAHRIAERLWEGWGTANRLSGGSLLSLVKRRLESLRIERKTRPDGVGMNSDVQVWKLTEAGWRDLKP